MYTCTLCYGSDSMNTCVTIMCEISLISVVIFYIHHTHKLFVHVRVGSLSLSVIDTHTHTYPLVQPL